MNTILNKILLYKKNWVTNQQKKFPINILKSKIQNSKRNFYQCLDYYKNQTIFILEYKQASPSKGIIRFNSDPVEIANIYKNYATIVSIVTDEKYFHGNFYIMRQISNIVTQPLLCKDFFISEWQIYFARLHEANAILLILSVLDDDTYHKFSKIAHSLNMGILTEISNDNELKRAISLGSKVIGINNRNLHDLSIDLNRTVHLSKKIPKSIIKISESGIVNYNHIRKLKGYVNGFLIGTALMSQKRLRTAIHQLMFGENKVCGITRPEDADISYKSGAIYGGLIFINHSSRCIDIDTAHNIILCAKKLCYVGIFCNTTIDYILNIVKKLNLHAVQLHGTENQDYIYQLRMKLPDTCQIWKSVDMSKKLLSNLHLLHIDRYLLDNGGGTGKTFDWSKISKIKNLQKTILAGGLTLDNCLKASKLGCIGLDFNSGIEISPGIKDHQKIIKLFQILKNY